MLFFSLQTCGFNPSRHILHQAVIAFGIPAEVSETEERFCFFFFFFPSNCPPEAEFLDEIITYSHLIQEITLLCNLASFTSQGRSSITGLSDDGSVCGLVRHPTTWQSVFFPVLEFWFTSRNGLASFQPCFISCSLLCVCICVVFNWLNVAQSHPLSLYLTPKDGCAMCYA